MTTVNGTSRSEHALTVSNFSGGFVKPDGFAPILIDLDFRLRRGVMTAIVGETGSGKSMTALSVLRIQAEGFRVTNGTITFGDEDIYAMSDRRLQRLRGGQIAMVFQDARSALNPLFPVGRQIADVCRAHLGLNRKDAEARALDLLSKVQIPEPRRRAKQYPHEFSGGMAQRVMIAMALAGEPELLLLDEPTTGLDVTIQSDVMALIVGLQQSEQLTACLITHDLGVVAESCDDVVVMNAGRIVEITSCERLFTAPGEDYTKTLLAASRLDTVAA
jgi:ABC-type dipeptide/oligopeptide/nickel transport system ATPase component